MRSIRAYTLVEMLLTIAVLILVLGVAVSLARHVRDRSAGELTADLLRKLDSLAQAYQARYGTYMTAIEVVHENGHDDEEMVRRMAVRNNLLFMRELRALAANEFRELPVSVFNDVALRDPWGSAIVYVVHNHPLVGMSPGNKPFFMSAGPDRRFLTRDDNLYSYEAAGGHGE